MQWTFYQTNTRVKPKFAIPEQEELERIRNDSKYRVQIANATKSKKVKKTYTDNTPSIQAMIADKVWFILGTDEHPNLHDLADQYRINYRTLQGYRQKLKYNPTWLPDQGHATDQYVFTEKQEKYMAKTILNYAASGIRIAYNLVRTMFLAYYNNLSPEELNNPQLLFTASPKFLRNFMRRHNISKRRAHEKRRPKIKPEVIAQYRKKVQYLTENYDPSHILNCDETFWRCADQGLYTWAPKGSDNIKISTASNEKDGFTALATIRFDGTKLPIIFVGKGTTHQCERSQFGFSNPIPAYETPAVQQELEADPNEPESDNEEEDSYYTAFSKSGWVTKEIWSDYLNFIRSQIPYIENTDPQDAVNRIFLICDAYSVHHSDISKELAAKLNIELIAVPKGATDECQPLDRRIFGALKIRGRAELNRQIEENVLTAFLANEIPEIPRFTKAQAAKILKNLFEELTPHQIIDAWNMAIFIDDDLMK